MRPPDMVAMRIPCPSCSAIYDVSDALLVSARMVRCAQCGHDWQTAPMAAPGGGPEESLTENLAAEGEPAAVAPPASWWRRHLPGLRENRVVLLGWVFSLLLLGSLGWAAIAHREGIMTAWPPSQRLFAPFGVTRGG